MDTLSLVRRLRITVTPGPLDTDCFVSGLSGERYAQVKVRVRTGVYRNMSAHRWVWQQLRGPIPEGLHVCHHCDVPKCMRLGHLYLGTPADNVGDQVARDRRPWGSAINTSKLSAAAVLDIRNSNERPGVLAARYGVSRQTVWRTQQGRSWTRL